MPKKTATIVADRAELLQLLDEWSQFRKWHSFVEAIQGFLKARDELFAIRFRLDHAERNEQTVENQDARFYWHLEANHERISLDQLQDASDDNELHWLRAEKEYQRLDNLIKHYYPPLLPLPGLDPLPETTDKQVECAERIGKIRGQILAALAKVKKPKGKVGRPPNPKEVKAFVGKLRKDKTPWKEVVEMVNKKYPKSEPWTEDALRKTGGNEK